MTQTLEIIGSLTSPFVRITRVVCEELGVPYKMDLTKYFGKNTEEQEELVKNNNPLMRVPVLIDQGQTIIDSRVIAAYLIKTYGQDHDFAARPPSLDEENILTTIYGIIDAGVLRFIIKNENPDVSLQDGYMERSLERLESGLAWLNQQALGQRFALPEAMLICGLEWMKKRDVIDWSSYTNLVKVHSCFFERASLVKTRIPEDA